MRGGVGVPARPTSPKFLVTLETALVGLNLSFDSLSSLHGADILEDLAVAILTYLVVMI
jgi:hypothetical protein